ncbi:Tetraspanin [Fasciola gigantica]|uniref:Tetraspanin n=1 Tax=Fasciola gigantica TaxID=46835 RepID=A0A504Z7A6_FASGI|nr:Tetraspanin [Fasciola gigantica]
MVTLSCGFKCLQVILVILNSVVLACGIGLICVGSLAESSLQTVGQNHQSQIGGMVIAVITVGCIIFLTGLLGFCGAFMKNACMLIFYGILLGILTAGLLASGIAGLVLRQEVPSVISKNLLPIYSEYESNQEVKKLIDIMQFKLQCCGLNGTWNSSPIPKSCFNGEKQLYANNCEEALENFLHGNLVGIAIAIFVIAFIQVMSMVFAACVIRAINSSNRNLSS